jgi:hypothetical protein
MKDPRPVFVRIAKLEERLKEKPKARFAFFKDSSRVLSVCAFVVSIVTTTYSWRKDDLQTHEAARREFDSTMQQAVDIGLKTYEFQVKNKDQPNLGAMMGWFNMQTGLLMNKSIQELAAIDDPSMFDYTVVGNIVAPGQPSRATTLLKKAIEIGVQKRKEHNQFLYQVMEKIQSKLFGKELDVSLSEEQREHDLGSTYTSLGAVLLSQKRGEEAKEAYEAAIQLYKDSNLTIEDKGYQISIVYKYWAEAEAPLDCNSSFAHVKKAAEYFPQWGRVADNLYWTSIQYELSYAMLYCGSDGKLHPPVSPTSNSVTITSSGPSMNNAPTWTDGNGYWLKDSQSPPNTR